MPQAMTFTSLQNDVRSYLERGASLVTDPLVFAQIPSLINFAERRISRDLKIQGFQVAVVTTLQAGVAVLAKPDRWRDTISMNIGQGLVTIPDNNCLRADMNTSEATGLTRRKLTSLSSMPTITTPIGSLHQLRMPLIRLRSCTTNCLPCWMRTLRPTGLPSMLQTCCSMLPCWKLLHS